MGIVVCNVPSSTRQILSVLPLECVAPNRLPSFAKTRLSASAKYCVRTKAPEIKSHRRTVLSALHEANRLVVEKTTLETELLWLVSVCSKEPLLVCQTLIVASSPPEASKLPSGENAAALTCPTWLVATHTMSGAPWPQATGARKQSNTKASKRSSRRPSGLVCKSNL